MCENLADSTVVVGYGCRLRGVFASDGTTVNDAYLLESLMAAAARDWLEHVQKEPHSCLRNREASNVSRECRAGGREESFCLGLAFRVWGSRHTWVLSHVSPELAALSSQICTKTIPCTQNLNPSKGCNAARSLSACMRAPYSARSL